MSDIKNSLSRITKSIPRNVLLVAVSKTKPLSLLKEAYDHGQRHFGENKAQEILDKGPNLPEDIKWHFIGHLQSKKVKQIIRYTHLIHSVDSLKLIAEIDKRAQAIGKTQDILIQVHIAKEESKFGIPLEKLSSFIANTMDAFPNTRVTGLMGMATFTDNERVVSKEFATLKKAFNLIKNSYFKNNSSFSEISMGMSGDYKLAIEEGSTMIRVGSSIFGSRD
jgi:pyridoxal phosphate enzyme (YggS family)